MSVTFGFPEACNRLRDVLCSCFQFTFSHSAEGVKHPLGSETLSQESWKKCQDDSVTDMNLLAVARCWFHQLFSHILSSFVLVKAEIAHPSVIIEVRGGGVGEHFYFLLRPLTVHQWSPASQLGPSSAIGWLKSFWQIAESKDLEKSGSRSCVFISVSPSNKH